MNKRKLFSWVVAILLVFLAGWSVVYVKHAEKINSVKIAKEEKKQQQQKKEDKDANMRRPIKWRKSSETKKYPDVVGDKDLWVKVSQKKQRLYVMSGKKKVYQMYVSLGTHSAGYSNEGKKKFPTGTFEISNKRGEFYFNQVTGTGGKYWISWKGDGKYLIQSVPTNEHGKYIVSSAQNLGSQVDTNNSIWLSVKDAKWFYKNINGGTKLVIE
ncbi:L,D-transpeptidase [Liquorilactobacillus mali]|uniref:Cell surface protein n=1 Tax=Liquorilactobacillus mali TaxID=1618 RepID=A0A0R2FGG6_9LACO|nr:L,D-transpeptidase [Liquorilactobacillus mali]KRN26774.1 cell surface protein [Liquorilactobacillus mali]MDN7144928.1 L,D-transpeptidase [Liquorilactobacillus mali]